MRMGYGNVITLWNGNGNIEWKAMNIPEYSVFSLLACSCTLASTVFAVFAGGVASGLAEGS